MKKKVFCALLCTAMVASLTACGGSSSSTAADTSSDAAAEETTEAADDTAEADTAEADTADAAASEGGKIFGYTCMDGTNYNAGYVCGEDLAKKVPDGGDILVLDSPTMQSVTDRTNGFLDAIKESGVTFNVVGQQDAQGNQQVANEKAQDLLTAHPDVVAIFGGNDPTALGAYAAADAAGVTPLIYGVDGSPDVKALLKDTILEGTGAQSPITIGETIANTAYEWLDGKEVESFIPIDTFLVTADNVDQYGTDGWQ